MIEMLAVMAISVILLAIAGLSIPGLLGSQQVDSAANDLKGLIDLARSQAMAGNTYIWLGIFEESPTAPGTPGTGQLVCSLVGSADGTQLYSGTTLPGTLPAGSLTQQHRLTRISGVHLTTLTSTQVTRSNIPVDPDQVGNDPFACGMTFNFPITGTQYTFAKIIQFSPQGDVTRPGDNVTQTIEIGLEPARGATAQANSKNVVVIQISGIGGQATIFRP